MKVFLAERLRQPSKLKNSRRAASVPDWRLSKQFPETSVSCETVKSGLMLALESIPIQMRGVKLGAS